MVSYSQKCDKETSDGILKKNSPVETKIDLLKEFSNCHFSNGEYELAIQRGKELSELAFSNDLLIDYGSGQEILGNVYSEINDFDQSIESYLEAISVFEKADRLDLVAYVEVNVASVYLKMEKTDQALNYLLSAEGFYKTDTSTYIGDLANTRLMIGVVYGSIEKLDSALKYLNLSTSYYSNSGDVNYGGLLNNLGAIYSKKEENTRALTYYEKALAFFESLGSEKGVAVTTGNIAYIYQKTGEYDSSIVLYEKAISTFEQLQTWHYLSNNYLNLSDVYKEMGDFEKALHYHELYGQLKDSVSNVEVIGRIEDLQIQYAIKKKDDQLKIIEQEKKLVEQENQLKESRFWLISGGLSFAIILLGLLIRNLRITLQRTKLREQLTSKKNEELAQEIVFKNKEMEQFALRIVEKNELLNELKKNLQEVSKQDNSTEKIREITSDINHSLYIDKDRKELELKIDHLHQAFLAKLSSMFPVLTKNDKRLCSLLMMDLSTKDIAAIMNIAPESVKKNRQRLRKKMELTPGSDINEFLKKII